MKTLFAFTFNSDELSFFDSNYFCNITHNNNSIEIQSINTGHWWLIKKVEMPIYNKVKVWHKYHESHPYHVQFHFDTCETACTKIKAHDVIVLNRSPKKIKQLRNKFRHLYCN